LKTKLQKASNNFMKQYKKGARMDEKINHIIFDYNGFAMPK